jgi:hypothetical protein
LAADPQALHAELLALAKPPVAGTVPTALTLYGPAAALTAVLELHKPEVGTIWPDGRRSWQCAAEAVYREYPCETVKVIAAALGVTTDG